MARRPWSHWLAAVTGVVAASLWIGVAALFVALFLRGHGSWAVVIPCAIAGGGLGSTWAFLRTGAWIWIAPAVVIPFALLWWTWLEYLATPL